MAKAINIFVAILCHAKSAAFAVCKNFFKSRTAKNLQRDGKPEKFMTIFEGHVTQPDLKPLMGVHSYAFIGS